MIGLTTSVLFSKEECELILNCSTEFKNKKETPLSIAADNIRNSKYGEVSNIDLLQNIILPKIKKFGINSIRSGILFIEYNTGDFFDKHVDRKYVDDVNNERVYTVIIQLSQESEYEGGNLIVKETNVSKELGTVVIFKSTDVHEVTKITKGTRKVCVFMPTRNDISKILI
jgi:predicted 2-oxoglutarate/Fe(II)-dependent dioxygenase YbiX